MKKIYRVGVDTGGTFTDICLYNEDTGNMSVAKVSSTPHDPALAVINGLDQLIERQGLDPERIMFFIHGTTVATNALLEGKGASTALITTSGFEDVLSIGRQNRPKLYDHWARRPSPIVPRRMCFGVKERILFNGDIKEDLDDNDARLAIEQIKKKKVASIAVCLLHSYANPIHEKRIKKLIQEIHPEAMVTLSSEVLPEFREYERMSTVCINCYVMPKVNAYLGHLVEMLDERRVASDLYIMQSNGGVITAEMAREASARTVLSGPAGGVLTGVCLSHETETPNLITIDIGGTSSDICLIYNHAPILTTEADIEGYPIKLPMIDINTIGAGGGSIAWIDGGGALRVGPESAGADPGPVCYGRGGDEPTVTDANAILGRINPNYLLGGEMPVDLELAKEVVERKIARPLGLNLMQAAEGIIRVVNANMIRGIRRVSVEKGYDPRNFSLVPFGGAGPLHGADLARALNISKVIVPVHPGIASATGMLSADVRHDYVRTHIRTDGNIDLQEVEGLFGNMEAQGRRQLSQEGFSAEEIELVRQVDMRYVGQSYEMKLDAPTGGCDASFLAQVKRKFHQAHFHAYGYARENEGVEFVNLRVVALGKLPDSKTALSWPEGNGSPQAFTFRPVHFSGKEWHTPIFHRSEILSGPVLHGPAIIEQLDSTVVVFPEQRATIDHNGNLIITLETVR